MKSPLFLFSSFLLNPSLLSFLLHCICFSQTRNFCNFLDPLSQSYQIFTLLLLSSSVILLRYLLTRVQFQSHLFQATPPHPELIRFHVIRVDFSVSIWFVSYHQSFFLVSASWFQVQCSAVRGHGFWWLFLHKINVTERVPIFFRSDFTHNVLSYLLSCSHAFHNLQICDFLF